MSGNPLFAKVHTEDGDEHKATSSAAALKSALEWGELVGFRRRYPSEVKQETPQPVENTGEGIVVVGKGASIVGEISNCSQVEIAGALEGKVVADVVIVHEGGCLKGHIVSDRAEVHGTIEGQIQVEDHLDIRATGDVSGEMRAGKAGPDGQIDDDVAYVTPWGFDPGAIAVPVLLAQGGEDRVIPPSHAEWLLRRCPARSCGCARATVTCRSSTPARSRWTGSSDSEHPASRSCTGPSITRLCASPSPSSSPCSRSPGRSSTPPSPSARSPTKLRRGDDRPSARRATCSRARTRCTSSSHRPARRRSSTIYALDRRQDALLARAARLSSDSPEELATLDRQSDGRGPLGRARADEIAARSAPARAIPRGPAAREGRRRLRRRQPRLPARRSTPPGSRSSRPPRSSPSS